MVYEIDEFLEKLGKEQRKKERELKRFWKSLKIDFVNHHLLK